MSSKTIKQILWSLSPTVLLEKNRNSPGEDQNQNSNKCLVGASDALCDCHKNTDEALCKILKSNRTVADKVISEKNFEDFNKHNISGCSCSQEKIGSLWDHGLLRDVKLRDVLQEEELSTREAAGITIRWVSIIMWGGS